MIGVTSCERMENYISEIGQGGNLGEGSGFSEDKR